MLRSLPDNASLPRLMTAAHPDAVGSYADDLIEWTETVPLHPKRSDGPRWWQRLALARMLEHDDAGVLVWPTVLMSAPRQTGKSWIERMVCGWRIHQSERFGEEQTVLHVAHKLVAAQEVWRPAARQLQARGAMVRRTNGEQQIELDDGSRWLVQAGNEGAGVAFSLSMALIDEAWRVNRTVVDEAITPTIAEACSPQIWLVSTAGTSASDLVAVNRAVALSDLDCPGPGSTLLMEWSAPPDPALDIDDEAVWRNATPHWDERRMKAMRSARVKSSERAFRQQWLNQWVANVAEAVIGEQQYAAALTREAMFGAPSFAVEITTDRSSGVIVAAGGGVIEMVDSGEGVGWIADRVRVLVARHDPEWVVFDSLGPAAGIAETLRPDIGAKLWLATGREVAAASGRLFDRLTAAPPTVALHHAEVLHRAVIAGSQRRYGQTWAFARDVIGGVCGAPLAAAALALAGSERVAAKVDVERSRIW